MSKIKKFGLMKTVIDAHTMGIRAAASLIKECGFEVIVADKRIEETLISLNQKESSNSEFLNWIRTNGITHLGFSYRLDPEDAKKYFDSIVSVLMKNGLYRSEGAQVCQLHFAGLPDACEKIEHSYKDEVVTFRGGEDSMTTLTMMGIPHKDIPKDILEGCEYDKCLLEFGEKLIRKGDYVYQEPITEEPYAGYGLENDSLMKRLNHRKEENFYPLVRAHFGPYDGKNSQKKAIDDYVKMCKELACSGYLDILSIGSSQLSQSNFGESWEGLPNGGGVPVNSEADYSRIWEASRPMLVRTYSGTKAVRNMAEMYDYTIHNAWHALSLWWFNELDGRGPNNLYEGLCEHAKTIEYLAEHHQPFEANVSHHFAFRGCDDVTYITTAYVAAKFAKILGIKSFILQNMLNTPRSTWGIQDIAKSRALLRVIKELEDGDFEIVFQTRAGLDYFKPDMEEAKIQLAAVTAMMDDIEPICLESPEIIHVVSYCEAIQLSTPYYINDSIKITRQALKEYRELKEKNNGLISRFEKDIEERCRCLESEANEIIRAMQEHISNLYSVEGLFCAFVAGWFPVPELWIDSPDYFEAKNWITRMQKGEVIVCNEKMEKMDINDRIEKCVSNIEKSQIILDRYKKAK